MSRCPYVRPSVRPSLRHKSLKRHMSSSSCQSVYLGYTFRVHFYSTLLGYTLVSKGRSYQGSLSVYTETGLCSPAAGRVSHHICILNTATIVCPPNYQPTYQATYQPTSLPTNLHKSTYYLPAYQSTEDLPIYLAK